MMQALFHKCGPHTPFSSDLIKFTKLLTIFYVKKDAANDKDYKTRLLISQPTLLKP